MGLLTGLVLGVGNSDRRPGPHVEKTQLMVVEGSIYMIIAKERDPDVLFCSVTQHI